MPTLGSYTSHSTYLFRILLMKLLVVSCYLSPSFLIVSKMLFSILNVIGFAFFTAGFIILYKNTLSVILEFLIS